MREPCAGESFTVTVEEEPKVIGDKGKISKADVGLVKDWVKVNLAKLVAIWNDELHPFDAHFRRLRCISCTSSCITSSHTCPRIRSFCTVLGDCLVDILIVLSPKTSGMWLSIFELF